MKKGTKPHVTISQDVSDDENDSAASKSPSEASDASESPDEYEKTKKRPKVVKEKLAAGDAMSKILAKKLNQNDDGRPVLAGAKLIEKQLDKEKKEYKVRKALALERKERESQARVKPLASADGIEYERQLKKIATRGVVKLFNAIRQAQHGEKDAKRAEEASIPVAQSQSDKAAWSVFHDDFATNPKTYEDESDKDSEAEQSASESD